MNVLVSLRIGHQKLKGNFSEEHWGKGEHRKQPIKSLQVTENPRLFRSVGMALPTCVFSL